jgi:hypothetical protein
MLHCLQEKRVKKQTSTLTTDKKETKFGTEDTGEEFGPVSWTVVSFPGVEVRR